MKRILLFAILISATVCLQAQNSMFFKVGGTIPMGKWTKSMQDKDWRIGPGGGAASIGGMFEIGGQFQIKGIDGLSYTVSLAGTLNGVKSKVKKLYVYDKYGNIMVDENGQKILDWSFKMQYYCVAVFWGADYEYSLNSDWSIYADGGIGLGISGTEYKYDGYGKFKSKVGFVPCFKLEIGTVFREKFTIGIMFLDMGRTKVAADPELYSGKWWDNGKQYYGYFGKSYFYGMKQVSIGLNIGYKLNFKNKNK